MSDAEAVAAAFQLLSTATLTEEQQAAVHMLQAHQTALAQAQLKTKYQTRIQQYKASLNDHAVR